MNEKNVLLRETLFTDFTFEGPIRIQIFLHRIAQLVALPMQKGLVMRRKVHLFSISDFTTVALESSGRVVVAILGHRLTVDKVLEGLLLFRQRRIGFLFIVRLRGATGGGRRKLAERGGTALVFALTRQIHGCVEAV